jgi:hypothetical protein
LVEGPDPSDGPEPDEGGGGASRLAEGPDPDECPNTSRGSKISTRAGPSKPLSPSATSSLT